MRSRNPASRCSPSASNLLLLSVMALFDTAGAVRAGDADIALQCRFPSGLSAIYIFNRTEARVRRADLIQPRDGRVRATAAEYRFIFQARASAYRIDVIIDRATGNTRRVFGTERNMERMPEHGGQGSGLVYEMGQCKGQYAEPR